MAVRLVGVQAPAHPYANGSSSSSRSSLVLPITIRGAALAAAGGSVVGAHEPRTSDRGPEGGEAMKHVLAIGDLGDTTSTPPATPAAPRKAAGPAVWVSRATDCGPSSGRALL